MQQQVICYSCKEFGFVEEMKVQDSKTLCPGCYKAFHNKHIAFNADAQQHLELVKETLNDLINASNEMEEIAEKRGLLNQTYRTVINAFLKAEKSDLNQKSVQNENEQVSTITKYWTNVFSFDEPIDTKLIQYLVDSAVKNGHEYFELRKVKIDEKIDLVHFVSGVAPPETVGECTINEKGIEFLKNKIKLLEIQMIENYDHIDSLYENKGMLQRVITAFLEAEKFDLNQNDSDNGE